MTTPNLGITLPTVGADADAWGTELNTALTVIDTFAGSGLATGKPAFAAVKVAGPTIMGVGTSAGFSYSAEQDTAISGTNTVADCLRFLDSSGAQIGNSFICGHVYVHAVDPGSSANNTTLVYTIQAMGTGATNAQVTFLNGVTNGTVPIQNVGGAGIQLVADGVGGAVKIQCKSAAATVTGATVAMCFVGLVK